MIRKILVITAAVFFASSVLFTSVIRTTAQTSPSYKINLNPMVAGENIEVSPVPTQSGVDYYLAYPGLLPNHVLYPLKMLRDKVWLFLTRDPVKKAEVLLLFADKRLGAAKALIEGGKQDLGITTLTKAEKYLEQAITQAEKVSQQRQVPELFEKLGKATLKHEEVIQELSGKVPVEARGVFEEILRYPQEGYRKLAPRIEEPIVEPEPEEVSAPEED